MTHIERCADQSASYGPSCVPAIRRAILKNLECSRPTRPNRPAAKALGISCGALYRHLAEPELKEGYGQLRAAAIADATESLQTVAEQAVSVLHQIANDPGVVPNVRVSAASKILDTAIKAHELQDILQRLSALEAEPA